MDLKYTELNTDVSPEYEERNNEYEIKCPWCGTTISDSLECFDWDAGDGDIEEIECECGVKFCAELKMEVTFNCFCPVKRKEYMDNLKRECMTTVR